MPWSIVAAFAGRTLQLTRHGWTGDYQFELQTPIGVRWIVYFGISRAGQAATLAAVRVEVSGGGRSPREKIVKDQTRRYPRPEKHNLRYCTSLFPHFPVALAYRVCRRTS